MRPIGFNKFSVAPATFVGVSILLNSASDMQLDLPAGAAVGDVALAHVTYGGGPPTGGAVWGTGWTPFTALDIYGASQSICRAWKVVTAADISTPAHVTGVFGNGNGSVLIYRGGNTVLSRNSVNRTTSGGTSIIIPSGAPSANSRKAITVFCDRDGWNGAEVATGMTMRTPAHGGFVYPISHGDSDVYPSSANVTWSGFISPGSYGEIGILYEITG